MVETEEGLAVINDLSACRSRHLFEPALRYFAACKSSEMSFSDLFSSLSK
jgi:hypothetical protein